MKEIETSGINLNEVNETLESDDKLTTARDRELKMTSNNNISIKKPITKNKAPPIGNLDGAFSPIQMSEMAPIGI